MATELGTAYVSIIAETSKLEAGIKAALQNGGKSADLAGHDIGKRISESASKAMRDGWRPDQDIMAGIPDTKLDRIGARIGQVIGKGIAVNMKSKELGEKFASGFQQGAGSIGVGKLIATWRTEIAASGGAMQAMGALAGKSLAIGLTGALGAATAGVTAVVGLVGTALVGGFKRLEALDTAKQKLLALKLSAADVKKTMDAVKSAVEGTPYALDEAFTVATQAIAGHVENIQGYISAIGDAAAFAKVGFSDMGDVFNDVLNKGKVTGDELSRLQERGVPAKSWIMESAKLTSDDYEKMQADGKITLDMLQKAVEDHASGMAKAGATTISGAMDQMKTALSRLGADFITAVTGGSGGDPLEVFKKAIADITGKLNEFDGWVKEHGPQIQQAFKDIGSAITTSFKFASDQIHSLISDIKLLATGLGNIFGAMAKVDDFLNHIPGMGGNEQESATLKQWQQNLLNWGDPNPAPEGGGGSNGPHRQPGVGLTSPGRRSVGPNDVGIPNETGLPNAQANAPAGTRESGGVTPSGINLSTIPLAAQKYANDCIDASARIILSHSGVNMSEDQLKSVIAPGGSIGSLASGLNQLNPQGNFQAVQGSGGSPAAMLSAIQGSINNGTGSILNVAPGSSLAGNTFGDGHFIAVTGYNPDGTINVSDTAKGTQYTVSAADAFQATKGRGIVFGAGLGPPPVKPKGYASGGSVDSVPAMLAPGEHVLTSSDVSAMGGQSGVYDFRSALHMAGGGAVTPQQLEDMRTKGYIPAAAGDTSKAGDSTIAKGIAIGGEVINGLIDQAASMASSAAGMGVNVVAPGAGGAASGAASAAIGLGTSAAKTGVKYGFKMAGIGVDALLQGLTPFGMPRWLSTDPGAFVPNQAIEGALGGLMSSGAQQAADASGIGSSAKAAPGTGRVAGTQPPGGAQPPNAITDLMGTLSPPTDPQSDVHGQNSGALPGPQMFQNQAHSFLQTELNQPEAGAPGQPPMFNVGNIYTTDGADNIRRELTKAGQLAAMQYTGRPNFG